MKTQAHTCVFLSDLRCAIAPIEADTRDPGGTFRVLADTPERAARLTAAIRASRSYVSARHQVVLTLPARCTAGVEAAAAVAILGTISERTPSAGTLVWGELDYDGGLRTARGALLAAEAARSAGLARIVVSPEDAAEASLAGIEVCIAHTLDEAVAAAYGDARGYARPIESADPAPPDLSDLRTSPDVKLALEVAAAGRHNLLLIGAPGVGKTMLARRLVGVLPDLSEPEAFHVARAQSLAGRQPRSLTRRPPFRAPHHTVSLAGLEGLPGNRSAPPRPGELRLAEHGVIFLDEIAEFSSAAIRAIRDAHRRSAPVLMVAAANLCPCGYRGSSTRPCYCSPSSISSHMRQLQSLRDLFDLVVYLPEHSEQHTPCDVTPHVRCRVERAIPYLGPEHPRTVAHTLAALGGVWEPNDRDHEIAERLRGTL